MRRLLVVTTLVFGCPRSSMAPASAVATPIAEEPQPPIPLRPPMRIAEAEPGGIEAKCRPERRAACLQAKAYPDERLRWELHVEPACRERECPPGTREPDLVAIVAALLEQGAYDVQIVGRTAVFALVSYADVIPAARLDAVRSISVECTGSAFCSCADLPVERCPEHAFCRPIEGHAITPRCISRARQVLGCAPIDQVCSAAETDVIAPDGTPWRLADTCLPSQPGWVSAERMSERSVCADG